jgi:tetratricopeptide (TPR) repeat protein
MISSTTPRIPVDAHVDAVAHDSHHFYAQATSLARQRQSDRAIHFLQLALNAGECSEVEALVLQGKIFVRDGRHLDAELCWSKALRIDPENVSARAALERLRRERLPGWRISRAIRLAGFLITVVTIVGFGVMQSRELRQAQADNRQRIEMLARSGESLANDIKARSDASERALAELQQALLKTHTALTSLTDRLDAERIAERAATADAIRRSSDSLAKESSAQLTRAHTILDAAIKSERDQQAEHQSAVLARMDRYGAAISDFNRESRTSISALDERLAGQMLALAREIESVRDNSDRLLWFRWPGRKKALLASAPANASQSRPAGVATTQPAGTKSPEGPQ